MALISFKIDDHFPGETKDANGHIVFEPSHTHAVGDTLHTVRPFTVSFHEDFTVGLEATQPNWAWKITITMRGKTTSGYYIVDVDKPFTQLISVDPATLEPNAEPEPAWWAMARASIISGTVNSEGRLILTRTDGFTVDAGVVKGKDGAPGAPGSPGAPGKPGADGKNPYLDVRSFGAVGDGITDDSPAFRAALENSGFVTVPRAGTYLLNTPLTLVSNTTLHISSGATLNYTGAGSAITATGVEGATKLLLSESAVKGSTTVKAVGHGLVAGDMFRLASESIFDPFSTSSLVGEILFADSVSGDTVTTTTALADSYTILDGAFVRKITPLRNIAISGEGSLRGNKVAGLGQAGIDFYKCVNVSISGINIIDIDRRHIGFSDCVDAEVDKVSFNWAVDNTMAYGVSFRNACRDSSVTNSKFLNVRHSLSTNNDTRGYGVPRRILFRGNKVRQTSRALGGSMGGGDAIDTHTAAEEIWIDANVVVSSTSQGINFECASGSVTRNKVYSTTSTGISVHNESGRRGRIIVNDNEVYNAGGNGITIRTGARGTQTSYERVEASRNTINGTIGSGIYIGATTPSAPAEENISVHQNNIQRVTGTYALLVTNALRVSSSNNTATNGATTMTINDSQPSAGGDAPGYLYKVIAAGAVTITDASRYVSMDTEGSTATDALESIVGGQRGQSVIFKCFANARDITIAASVGNIRLTAAMTLDNARDSITLAYDGTSWNEVARANYPAA